MRRTYALLIAFGLTLPSLAYAAGVANAADQSAQHVRAGTDAAARSASHAAQTVGTQTEAAAQTSERHGISRWIWVALLAVILVLLIAAFARRRRSQAVIRSRIG